MDQPARSSRGKVTKIARSLAGKWTSLIVVLLSRMYILAFGPLPSASQNDDASTGLVSGLKLTKMQVRTFWTAPNTKLLVKQALKLFNLANWCNINMSFFAF